MSSLAGRTILITRSQEQTGQLGSTLEAMGARIIEAPVIGFVDPADWGPADAAIADLADYDRIILTSVNAVERFHARLSAENVTVPACQRLMAIGPATAHRMELLGFPARVVASDSRAEGILSLLLAEGDLRGRRILIPRAEVARELLPERLREAGARVDVVSVYRTVALPITEEVLATLGRGQVDVITFTSSSTVTNFLAAAGAGLLQDVVIAVIGPVTAQTVRAAGLEVRIESPSAEMTRLAGAIADYFEKST